MLYRRQSYLRFALICGASTWACSSEDPVDQSPGTVSQVATGTGTTVSDPTTTVTGSAGVDTSGVSSSASMSASTTGGAMGTSTTTTTTTVASTSASASSAGGASSVSSSTDAALTTTGMGGTGGNGTDCEGGKVVHFVYFVEADVPYSESQRADIEAQAYNFQQYWYEQLGVTFYLNDPVVDVIEADHESDWYLDTPDGIHSDERWYRLGNVKNEVYEKLGIDDFDSNHRVVNYPTTRHDGRVGGNFGGAWMDGDDLSCMAEPDGVNYPYDDGSAAHCLGHVAHEFGHVLGLDHQGPEADCMQYGFYVSFTDGEMCDFSADNVAEILAEPNNEGWFEAEPGETCRGL